MAKSSCYACETVKRLLIIILNKRAGYKFRYSLSNVDKVRNRSAQGEGH